MLIENKKPSLFDKFVFCTWKDWNEWNIIIGLISNKNDENVKIASEKIISWSRRSTLPIPLEIYGFMLRELYESENINAVSLLIIRFCNRIVGSLKTQNIHVPFETLYRIAGVPEYLIKIRHCLTHGIIPSKDVLKRTAKDILDYIEMNYFEQQKEYLNNQSNKYREFIISFINNNTNDVILFDSETIDTDYAIGTDVFFNLIEEGTINSDNIGTAVGLLIRCSELSIEFKKMVSLKLASSEKYKGQTIYTNIIDLMLKHIDSDIINDYRKTDGNSIPWNYISIGMNPFGCADARLSDNEYIIL